MEERSIASYLFEIIISVLVWIIFTRILNKIVIVWMNRRIRKQNAKASTA